MGSIANDCDCTDDYYCTCHNNPLNCDKTKWKCNNCGHDLENQCKARIEDNKKTAEYAKAQIEEDKKKGMAAGSVFVSVRKSQS